MLPGWLHALLLALFAAGLAASLWFGFRGFAWPRPDEAVRRLEQDSGAPHRPLSLLDDSIAGGRGDKASESLWEAHRRRMIARLAALKAGPPHPVMAAADPRALRAPVLLLLVVGLVLAGGQWRDRLGAAFQPRLALAETAPPPALNVWISPPEYTGVAPLLLETPGQEPTALAEESAQPAAFSVPAGSELMAQVDGGRGEPSLVIGETQTAFEAQPEGTFQISRVLEEGGRIAVTQDGEELGAWAVDVRPDGPPEVEFMQPPGRTERSVLRLEYGASDDYGLESVRAEVQRIDDPDIPPMVLDLPLSGGAPKSAQAASYHDLTPHPWAGLAVEVTLVAADALEQEGRSDAVRTVLPERIFNHPVARALVELRRQLTLDPGARLPVVQGLSELQRRPEHFFNDVVVALALRSAERRLVYGRGEAIVPEVQQLMWDTALRIEEGDLAIAERDLRDVQQRLQEALARDASDAEIQQLMDELEQAIDRFMQALMEKLQQQMAEGQEPQPLPPDAQTLDSQQLQEMLDRARELAQQGARDAAQQLLSQLQEMLENLQAQPFAQMNQESQDAFEMLRNLEDMMRRQQELLDRSHQRAQGGEPQDGQQQGQQQQGQQGQMQQGQRPGGEMGQGQMQRGQGQQGQMGQGQMGQGQRGQGNQGGDAQLQEQLRRELGEMMRRLGDALGDIPRPLGNAEQAMREARDALENNAPGQAIDPQSRALDQLQQGLEQSAESFMQQMGPAQGEGQGQAGMPQNRGRDPLGRRSGSGNSQAIEGVQIPSEMEMRRAREILDELRRRRGERSRPAPELDYLDRLLKQF